MTSPLSRRNVLRTGALGSLGIVFAGSIEAIAGTGAAQAARVAVGYGPLVPDPAGLLSLPQGFSYKIVAKAGATLLESGHPTPDDMDGTGFFTGPNGAVLVNNHEIGGSERYGVPALPGLTYDPAARGGTTNIMVDSDGNRVGEYVSLAGTHNNCAGGVTPWNTWLTCEETEQRANAVFKKDHGYVFEVDAFDRAANLDPIPLKFLGRYAHEAVAVDPKTHAIYLTEDASGPNGLYYRWTPPAGFQGGKGALRALALAPGGDTAGKLQAMSCFDDEDRHIADLSHGVEPGTKYKVKWIDVPDRDARTVSVRKQFTNDQVTRARKLEGAWWADGGAYFVASYARFSDGSVNEHDGQVWFYNPAKETVTLTTIFGVNPDPDNAGYDGPDTITVSPYGGVILAEDGEGIQSLVGVTEQGKAFTLARNELNDNEFAGPVFSSDGKILYVGIQNPGHVLAITGPWGRPSNAAV